MCKSVLSTRIWSLQLTLFYTHPSEVAHSLEVDEVALAGVQRAIPVAIISVIVTHSKGTGLRQAAGWQLSCVVVRCASGLGFPVRHGQWEALLDPQLPLHFLPGFLFNHYLVCTVQHKERMCTFNKLGSVNHLFVSEMVSSPNRCSSALGGAQQDSNCALGLTQRRRHVSIIKCGRCGHKTQKLTCTQACVNTHTRTHILP